MSEIRATIVIYCEKTQAAQQTWCICRRRCGTTNTVSFWTKASGGSGVRWSANGSFAVRGRNESESLVSGIGGGNHYIVFRFETDCVAVHVQAESIGSRVRLSCVLLQRCLAGVGRARQIIA